MRSLLFRFWIVTLLLSAESLGAADIIPTILLEPSSVCAGTQFRNRRGDVVMGTRACNVDSTVAFCTVNGQVGCRTNAEFKSAPIAGLAAKVLKSERLAEVVGTAPVRPPDCVIDGGSSCVVDGTVFRAVKLSQFSASNILTGHTLVGMSGSLVAAPADCASDNAGGCVATSSFPAVNKAALQSNAANLFSTWTLLGVTGTLTACSADAASLCLVEGRSGYKAAFLANLDAANIRIGTTIAGLAGTLAANPADCTAEGAISCLTTSSFPAVDKANSLSATNVAKIHSSLAIAGGQGTLVSCASDGAQDCFATGAFAAGSACSDGGSQCFIPPFQTGTQPLQAIDSSRINPGLIKNSVAVLGIVGSYPSVATPLTFAAELAAADLVDGTLTAQMQNAANFGWFDAAGNRYIHGGSADLIGGNIKGGITLFGVSGTGSGAASVDPWDIRTGKTIAGVTGELRVNCRNLADPSVFSIGEPRAASINTSTSVVTIADHGFANGDEVRFIAEAGASPGGLSLFSSYYACEAEENTFKLGMTNDCTSLVNISTPGSGVFFWRWNTGIGNSLSTLHDRAGANATFLVDSVNTATDDITILTSFPRQRVRFSVGPIDTMIGGLSPDTTYWLQPISSFTYKVSLTSFGAPIDITSAGSGTAVVPVTPSENVWGDSKYVCSGLEATAGDGNVWRDVTIGGCTSSAECRFMDKITKTEWSEQIGTGANSSMTAASSCDSLLYDGLNDWRLPTLAEFREAEIHGIRSVMNDLWISLKSSLDTHFTATAASLTTKSIATFNGIPSNIAPNAADSAHKVICVRP